MFMILTRLASAPDSKPPPIPAKPAIKPAVKPKFVPDKRAFENINEKCRPSVIAMRYNALESEEWIDAKEALEDNFDKNEDEIVKFLSDLLMVSMQSMKMICTKVIRTALRLYSGTLAYSSRSIGSFVLFFVRTLDWNGGVYMSFTSQNSVFN